MKETSQGGREEGQPGCLSAPRRVRHSELLSIKYTPREDRREGEKRSAKKSERISSRGFKREDARRGYGSARGDCRFSVGG